MKLWPINGISLALNAILAVAIFLSFRKSPPLTHAPVATTTVSTGISQSPPTVTNTSSPGLPFQWSQIASEDLKVYRDHLRAIGCPELTVREIIRAVINERFVQRRQDILASFQGQYWDMVLRRELVQRQIFTQSKWGRSLSSLAAEREQLIADVLGQDALVTEAERQTQQANLKQRLSWLSPEKRARLIELEKKHDQQLAAWNAALGSRVNSAPTQEDGDQLQKIQQDFDESEKELLTPEELTELKLRSSDVANWAASLPGFKPTEDEWRSLTGLRSQYEESQNELANQNLTEEQRTAQQNELQSNFDNAIKAALDPDQYAQYQLANNDQYQAIHNVTQRYGLPDSVASQSLNVQQEAQAAAAQVRANASLSPDAQQAALNAIQQATEQNLSQIFGSQVLSTYKEYGGDWISGLSH